MAVSHSFAGEHVEDRSDEEADADRNHHEIEHVTLLPSDHRRARLAEAGQNSPV
jgi:hypothetical protein